MAAEKNFRRNLQTAIEKRKLKISHVAKNAKTSRPYIYRIIDGETDPGLAQCERLANAVGFDLRDLLLEPKIFADSLLTSVHN